MRRVTVRGVVVKDGKLLAARLKSYPEAARGAGSFWCIPGGKLEASEGVVDALVREMVEETGVVPVPGNLLYVQQYGSQDDDNLEFFFHVRNARAYENIDLSNTTHGDIEIEEIAFVDPKSMTILPKFFAEEDLETHVLSGGPVRFFSYLEGRR